jgi:hypothetical protein
MTEQELNEWYIRMAEAHTEAAPDEAIADCGCDRCFEAQKMYDGIS